MTRALVAPSPSTGDIGPAGGRLRRITPSQFTFDSVRAGAARMGLDYDALTDSQRRRFNGLICTGAPVELTRQMVLAAAE
jgi:hypothetical protein